MYINIHKLQRVTLINSALSNNNIFHNSGVHCLNTCFNIKHLQYVTHNKSFQEFYKVINIIMFYPSLFCLNFNTFC